MIREKCRKRKFTRREGNQGYNPQYLQTVLIVDGRVSKKEKSQPHLNERLALLSFSVIQV
jgi:hypothetical protein